MSATPLIQKLKKGTSHFYAMSSGINQEQMASTNETIKFNFSKFICLNIPNIKTPISSANNIQFNTIDGQIIEGLNSYNSINLVQSFQNYALNLETVILNESTYDNTTLKTVSERVFFKWLKELGAIRFRSSYENESIKTRFVEEDEKLSGSILYNRVIKYIGDVDIVNNVQHKGSNYTEVYINIPTEVGNTPVILFDTIQDNNYKPSMILRGIDETLYNRDLSTIHPDGLSINAFYDYDTNVDYVNSINANWYNQNPLTGNINSYFTELVEFNNTTNIDITKKYTDYVGLTTAFTDIVYKRSKLDGISIDFNADSYTEIVENLSINNIQEFNSSLKSTDFEFNTVLLYYDIYTENNQAVKETNLYGILFLDNLVEEVDESYIPRFKKYKHNPFLNKNGNSYSFKLNLKNTQSVFNSNVETVINDYNTFSMSLFTDTMIQLQNSVINFQEQNRQLLNIAERLTYLESLIYSIPTVNKLENDILNLSNKIDMQNLAYENSNILLDMISNLNDKYNQLINQKAPVKISYDSNIIQSGKGIEIDRSITDKVILHNKIQAYNISMIKNKTGLVLNSTNRYNLEEYNPELYVYLKDYSNYVKIYTDGELNEMLKIFIVDNNSTFENGQLIKLAFNYLPKSIYNIVIYSDYNNKFGYGKYNKILANIDYNEISEKPIIDLICLDKNTYLFDYNIIN